MNTASTWVFVVIVLAIVIPMGVVVLRRMIRGEPMEDSGKSALLPPSGPDIGGTGA